MGGCDQWSSNTITTTAPQDINDDGVITHCASFDTLFTLSSNSVVSDNPKASRITISGIVPPARLRSCTVVMPNNNVLMIGGEDPLKGNIGLADAWILDTQSWTWEQQDIRGLPADGIMGHSCLLAHYDQILVVG
ncbi:hypothetical protein BGZ65_000073, partial [Modicella reniformis]